MHFSRKACHILHLHYQGKLVKEKLFKENLRVCTVGKFSLTSGLVKENLLVYQIGQHILLPINHNLYNFRENNCIPFSPSNVTNSYILENPQFGRVGG